jgi:hypothetical protein
LDVLQRSEAMGRGEDEEGLTAIPVPVSSGDTMPN